MKLVMTLTIALNRIPIFLAVNYEFRLDLLPPCQENRQNNIRMEWFYYRKMNHNQFLINGSFVVNELMENRLQVSPNHLSNCFEVELFLLQLAQAGDNTVQQ